MNGTSNMSSPGPQTVCHGLTTIAFKLTASVRFTAISSVVLNIILIFLSVIGNGIVVYTIIFTKALQKVSFVLVGYVSFLWLLNSLSTTVLLTVVRIQDLLQVHNCSLKLAASFSAYFLRGLCYIGVIASFVDKYISVKLPRKREKLPLAIIYSIAVGILNIVWFSFILKLFTKQGDLPYLTSFIGGTTGIWFLLLFFFYIETFIRLRKLKRVGASIVAALGDRQREKTEEEDRRRVKNLLMLVSIHTIPLLGKICCTIARAKTDDGLLVAYHCHRWTGLLFAANAAINPIFCILRVKAIKAEVLKMIGWSSSSTVVESIQRVEDENSIEIKEETQ
ncbi:uncharacterized protein LOC135684414 [Rhopilema esculentum]|uniref:uncharacterized protein LOC135684414 n=1 Tax=Rhopilema esculentum TaxID=499914 RepID=UPI0031CE1602